MSFYQQKKQGVLPQWVTDFGHYIGIGLVVLLMFLGTKVVAYLRGAGTPVPIPHAELVVVLGPVRTWQEESDTKIKSVEVRVQNQGSVRAQGVVVRAVVRGSSFVLPGKSSLEVGEIASYSTPVPVSVTADDKLEFKLECATCAAFSPGR